MNCIDFSPISKGLTMDEETHTYFLNGLILPSVSQIIKPLSDKVYRTIDEGTLAKAATKGTDVHFDIQQYINTGWLPDSENENYGYFTSFLNWWGRSDLKTIGTEIMVYHPSFLYAGTIDLLAEADESFFVIDFKTTVDCHPNLWEAQLTGYKKIIEFLDLGKPVKIMVIHLSKNEIGKEVKLQESSYFMPCLMINSFIP